MHALLTDAWASADAWAVGRYVLMPDHLHLFAAPMNTSISLDNWVRFWKSQFSKGHADPEHRWQSGHWDRRLRDDDSYDEKWRYVRDNPVRHGFVLRAEEWPYQGELERLRWH